ISIIIFDSIKRLVGIHENIHINNFMNY
ncbi:hypothetical protein JL09_g5388, partial [Pichia kudriavzevii]